MRRAIIVSVIMALCLSCHTSCTTTNDRARTQGEGAAVGAALGAFLGGVIGVATGDSKRALKGAAIGAAAGGLAGYAYGTHVANQKAKYASREDWLNACIASIEQVIEETRSYNMKLGEEIRVLEAETMRLQAAYRDRKATKSNLDQEKNILDIKIAEADEKLKKARFEKENQEDLLAELKASGQTMEAEKLEARIVELNGHVSDLEAQIAWLSSLSRKMIV
ncbi:MAG: YMGG-like glycine zipper-containing protein [Desulfatiglandaceae bacterium]